MYKRLIALAAALFLLGGAALAEGLPISFKKTADNGAPYEKVRFVEESPFAADAELLTVDVLGIRQGDCILISCGGETMLVDGGEADRFPAVNRYLQAHGIDRFDYFFLTHAHDDHLEMQQRLLRRGYTVGELISPYDENDSYSLWNEYKAQLAEAGVPLRKIASGDSMQLGGATLTFYRWDNPRQTMNNHSACAMLQFGEARMFLAADVGGEAQHWLLETFGAETFRCDVYKSAHHNRTATVPEFLDALSPGLVVNTNTRSSTKAGENQQDRRDIPRYYISTGTVHLSTDGTQWFVWQEAMDAK